jgi:serine/threonine-protein kinase
MRRGLPQLGETIASKYLVTGELGRGGMGAVYVVEHRLTGKRLAVKCLLPEHVEHPELVERFLREAQAAGRIQHRYVVDVFDVGRDGELLYIVMELLEGKVLSELLRDATLPLEELLAILLRAMEGVAAAHAHGIVHRDLKPENIIVCAGHSGRLDDPRVLDFGISKLEEDASGPLTKSGVMMGTPYYMSFEQISTQRDIDHRVDVYAMGVILYEALCGRVPYIAESVGALAVRMLTVPPEPIAKLRPDLPPELAELIMRSIARDRDERFPTMRALIDALAPFAGQENTGITERTAKPLGLATGSNSSVRLAGGEEPTLLMTPARTEPRVSTPARVEPAAESRLRVSAQDDARPEPNEPGLPVGRLLLAAAALLIGTLLTTLLWPDSKGEVPERSAPAGGAGQEGQRVVVPQPSPALAPLPTPAPITPAEPASRAAQPPAPLDAVLDTAGFEPPETTTDAKGRKGAQRRRRDRNERTLDQMVPQAPLPPETEREDRPAPAEKPAEPPAPPAEVKTEPLPAAPEPKTEAPPPEAPAPAPPP